MTDPEGVSLKALGLQAPDGLECPAGGQHHILQPDLQVAIADVRDAGIGRVRCEKCGGLVDLLPLRAL